MSAEADVPPSFRRLHAGAARETTGDDVEDVRPARPASPGMAEQPGIQPATRRMHAESLLMRLRLRRRREVEGVLRLTTQALSGFLAGYWQPPFSGLASRFALRAPGGPASVSGGER